MLHADVAVTRGVLGAVDAPLDFGDFVELDWAEDEAEAKSIRAWVDVVMLVVMLMMLKNCPIRVHVLRRT